MSRGPAATRPKSLTCACGGKLGLDGTVNVGNEKAKVHSKLASGCNIPYGVHVTMLGSHCVSDGKRV